MRPALRSSPKLILALALFAGSSSLRAGRPVNISYGAGHVQMMKMLMDAQTQFKKRDLAGAQRKLDAMLKADPAFYPAYYLRAQVFLARGRYEDAARDAGAALKKDSTFAEAALLRARANYLLNRCGDSLKEIDHVISIRPRQDALARAYHERAILRLFCRDSSYRDGQQAIKDATMACKLFLWTDEDTIDTLALAYAAIGDFDSAARFEEKALAVKGAESDDKEQLQQHLEAFKQHRSVP